MGFIRRWDDEHPDGQELTHGETFGWEHGWHLYLASWEFGVAVNRQFGERLWPNRLTFSLELGPLTWSAFREWQS